MATAALGAGADGRELLGDRFVGAVGRLRAMPRLPVPSVPVAPVAPALPSPRACARAAWAARRSEAVAAW